MAVALLAGLAAIVGAVSIAAIWANDQLLDTSSWVSTSDRMLGSRDLRHRVSVFLAEELVGETEAQLGASGETEAAEAVLPELRRRAPELAERIIATPQFRHVWQTANRIGHRTLVRILDEETAGSRGGGRVVVDLTPALRELADDLGRGQLGAIIGDVRLGSFVQPGAARIEVLEADELEQAQDVVRAIRHVPVPATIATLVLLALALLVGRARLPRTVAIVGLGLTAAGALALLARALAGHEIVDRLLVGAADREAAEAAWRIATSTIVDLAAAAIGLGGLLALFGFLLGGSGAARGLRRGIEPLVATPLARLWAAALLAVAFVVLLVWQPIAAFGDPLGVLLFAIVLGGGCLILSRTVLHGPRY